MSTALEKIQKLQEQIEATKAEAIEELREKRREAAKVLADLDAQIAALNGGKTRKGAGGSRKCGNCGEFGHNSRSCPTAKKK